MISLGQRAVKFFSISVIINFELANLFRLPSHPPPDTPLIHTQSKIRQSETAHWQLLEFIDNFSFGRKKSEKKTCEKWSRKVSREVIIRHHRNFIENINHTAELVHNL